MTAQEVIERGMRLLGVLESGETPTTNELADGLEVLNSMVAFWGSQSWCVPYHVQDSLTLTISDGAYTIGSGQDIDTLLPMKIVSAWTRDTNGNDWPLEIIPQEEYANIWDKDFVEKPEKLCFVKSGTTGTLYLWPEPDAADTLYIESTKRLGNYALSDQLGLPQEYERPLCYNFATEFALEFQIEVGQTLAVKADESLTNLKAVNSQPVPTVCTNLMGIGNPSNYDVYSDNY